VQIFFNEKLEELNEQKQQSNLNLQFHSWATVGFRNIEFGLIIIISIDTQNADTEQ
jgi:hypothetical protein